MESIVCCNKIYMVFLFLIWCLSTSFSKYLKVDRSHLVTFVIFLPYTRIFEVDIHVCLQMYIKKPGSIPDSLGANLKLLRIIEVH